MIAGYFRSTRQWLLLVLLWRHDIKWMLRNKDIGRGRVRWLLPWFKMLAGIPLRDDAGDLGHGRDVAPFMPVAQLTAVRLRRRNDAVLIP